MDAKTAFARKVNAIATIGGKEMLVNEVFYQNTQGSMLGQRIAKACL